MQVCPQAGRVHMSTDMRVHCFMEIVQNMGMGCAVIYLIFNMGMDCSALGCPREMASVGMIVCSCCLLKCCSGCAGQEVLP